MFILAIKLLFNKMYQFISSCIESIADIRFNVINEYKNAITLLICVLNSFLFKWL